MATITASDDHGLDMLETAISSLLEPTVASPMIDQIMLTYPGGFSNILHGRDFILSATGEVAAGTVTGLTEMRDGAVVFRVSDLALSASSLTASFAEGDHDDFFAQILSGDDVVLGGAMDDRLVGFDGADTIKAGAGDDVLDGGLGDDAMSGGGGDDTILGGAGDDLFDGGAGDDLLDGGAGEDLARYSGWFRDYSIRNGADLTVTGEGTDVLRGVERISFADGMLEFGETASFARVTRLFASVLDRAPDRTGLDFYVDRIEDWGVSLVAVANDLVGSAEFRAATGGLSDAGFVDHMYRQVLGRAADAGGALFYAGQLAAGMSRGAFVVDLSESAEHRDRTAALTEGGYFNPDDAHQAVALLYNGAFGRLPDAAGLGHYAGRVKTGAITLAQVAADFAGSAEFGAAIFGKNNGEIIDFIYRNTLERLPDPGGRAFYAGLLDGGASVAQVFQEIGLSMEHYYLYSAHIIDGIDVL